jgi:N-methylhydantoinase A
LLIVQSNGGVCSAATAAAEPVRLLLSGPSGGALGARTLARTLGEPNLVGVDMGGTSFDVSVVADNRIEVVAQSEIDRLPVRVPMIEIRTIGAGGGSIARVDGTGRATVGPQSAGARPGPVCYGRGGTEPTVTDANLLLGRLDPAFFLGGRMPLDLGKSNAALRERFAVPLGLELEPAAQGLLTLTDTNLASAIRVSLFEKGLDPRDFCLASFGGAGSIHACAVADELGISRIVFPMHASTFSAWGILHSDIGHDFARSRVMPFDDTAEAHVTAMFAEMAAEAATRLTADGIAPTQRRMAFAADLRYRGQAFELTVPYPAAGAFGSGVRVEVARAFHASHLQRFSYADVDDAVELVTLRLTAVGLLERATTDAPLPQARVDQRSAVDTGQPIGTRRVWLQHASPQHAPPRHLPPRHAWHDVPVWRREEIGSDCRIVGPAIIEEEYTTALVAVGWTAVLGAAGAIVAARDASV